MRAYFCTHSDKRLYSMRINFRTILLALPLAFASCSDFSDADTRPATGTISVSVGSGPKIDIESEDKTRTELGEDGVSVKWSSDDQIALWAVNSRSETTLDKQVFKLYHYNAAYNTARFTGNIAPMPEDTYTYYAVSPAPAESNGTEATYLIPAVQNGAFNGDWDVMVAEPVTAPALEKDDTGNTVQFQFRHKVHVLKIRIPKNDLGEKVSEITLAFPQPVTGRMTVDAAKPDAAPTLTSGSSTLTLRFDEPKDAGDVVFAVIAPIKQYPSPPSARSGNPNRATSRARTSPRATPPRSPTTFPPSASFIRASRSRCLRTKVRRRWAKKLKKSPSRLPKVRCSTTVRMSANLRRTPTAVTRWSSNRRGPTTFRTKPLRCSTNLKALSYREHYRSARSNPRKPTRHPLSPYPICWRRISARQPRLRAAVPHPVRRRATTYPIKAFPNGSEASG